MILAKGGPWLIGSFETGASFLAGPGREGFGSLVGKLNGVLAEDGKN